MKEFFARLLALLLLPVSWILSLGALMGAWIRKTIKWLRKEEVRDEAKEQDA